MVGFRLASSSLIRARLPEIVVAWLVASTTRGRGRPESRPMRKPTLTSPTRAKSLGDMHRMIGRTVPVPAADRPILTGMRIHALVLAGGSGDRFAAEIPK